MLRLPLFLTLIALVLNGCQLFEVDDDRDVIARVGENFLYEEEIEDLVVEGDSAGTILLVKNYVDNWVKEQLLLQKALQNLSETQADFQEQLEDYKNSLLIYAYENLLVTQKLDTIVSKKELLSYFNENQHNFKLKEQLVKGKFVQLLNSAPMQDSLNIWLFSKTDEYELKLNEYCTQFTINCHLDTSKWVPFSSIQDVLPVNYSLNNMELFIGKNIISDTSQTLVLNILNQRFPGQLAPLSFVSDQIKSIIRNKRKLQLLNKAREEIYEEATLKKQYEVYN